MNITNNPDGIIKSDAHKTGKFIPFFPNQTGIYFECLKYPTDLAYNLPFRIDFPLRTNPQKIADALKTVMDAHPVLKTVVDTENGTAGFRRRDSFSLVIPIRENTVDDIKSYEQHFCRPFDLSKELFRAEIFLSRCGVHLLFDAHHLIYDGDQL
jgi:hypothetical protein